MRGAADGLDSSETHNRIVLSSAPPDKPIFPSGLHDTEYTEPLCPLKHTDSLPVATSHTRATPSTPAEARDLPSGLNATEIGVLTCPVRVAVDPFGMFFGRGNRYTGLVDELRRLLIHTPHR
jgi:hypothetical protein